MRVEHIGDATLYLGDSLEIAPTLSGIEAVVADPQYGMDWDTDSTRFSGGQRKILRGDGRNDWGKIYGDNKPFNPTPWLSYSEVILWGANHYAQLLPVGTTLVWIKKGEHLFGTFLSDCEIGWQKGGHGVYAHFKQFPPPSRMAENDGRSPAHASQKPISLMRWCVGRVRGRVILDPYMGSGTTGIACYELGREYVGIEISAREFDTACRRIERAHKQHRLFDDPKPEATQLDIFSEVLD